MKQNPDYKDRLLEIHGTNMLNGYHVQRAIEFAKKFDLTGIIFPVSYTHLGWKSCSDCRRWR